MKKSETRLETRRAAINMIGNIFFCMWYLQIKIVLIIHSYNHNKLGDKVNNNPKHSAVKQILGYLNVIDDSVYIGEERRWENDLSAAQC